MNRINIILFTLKQDQTKGTDKLHNSHWIILFRSFNNSWYLYELIRELITKYYRKIENSVAIRCTYSYVFILLVYFILSTWLT